MLWTKTARPEEVGMSSDRLERIRATFRDQVERGILPGAVFAVARRGKTVCFETVGRQQPAHGEAIRPDAIFRIYSMTKPLTAVGVMMLAEEGRFQLSDPVCQFLPEFERPRVAVVSNGKVELVPAGREITIHDLLCHTSGLSGGFSGTPAVLTLYEQEGIGLYEHDQMAFEMTSEEFVRRLGRLPLAHHPGTVFEYSLSYEVLGRLIEVVTGTGLDEFLRERLFQPLGMTDTGFYVEPEQAARLVQPLTESEVRRLIAISRPPRWVSGGSGAYSTVPDYMRFLMMLSRGGEWEGKRLISRKTVELMTADHLGPLAGSGPDYIPGAGYGYGLGFACRTHRGASPAPGSLGDYYWLGRASTSFLVDPQEELIAVFMSQKYGTSRPYHWLFRMLVYQCIVD